MTREVDPPVARPEGADVVAPDALGVEPAIDAAAEAELELAEQAARSPIEDPVLSPIGPESEPDAIGPVVAGELAVEAAAAEEMELAAEAATAPVRDPVLSPLSAELAAEVDAAEAAAATTPASRPRRRKLVRFAGGFVFGLLAVLALSAGGLYALDLEYTGRALPGVHVGDVDLSGLTAAQAGARLAGAYDSLANGHVVLRAGSLTTSIPLGELGRRADVESMVSEALAVGRAGSGVNRLLSSARTAVSGVVLEPTATLDRAAIERAVASFAASVSARPVDARIENRDSGFVLVPSSDGRTIDSRTMLETAVAALQPIDLPLDVEVEAPLVAIPPVVTTEDAAPALEAARQMSADIAVVDDVAGSWSIPAAQVRSWISFEVTGGGGYRAVAKPAALDAQLATIAEAIDRPAKDATYLFDKSGRIVGASAGQDGRGLDAAGTVAAITAALAQRAGGATVASVPAAVSVVKPALTTEQASATAPLMQKVSEWTTYFPISDRNGFGANIWIPAMDIDGYVVAPGAVFDFWKAIGPVTRERGYRDGGAIINGKTEPTGALAGGICSTSTTLFNAALRAGLKMGARQNHYYYISRYPLGLDATVWQSSSGSIQSMTFQNDTGYPILIRGYKIRNGSSGYVKFELYGVPTGRTVTLSTPIVKNVRVAVDTVSYTSSLKTGTSKRLETPTDGKDVWATVTVRDANGAQIRQTTYYSHYARIDGITLVGTG